MRGGHAAGEVPPGQRSWRSWLFGLVFIPTSPATADASIAEGDDGTVDVVIIVALSTAENLQTSRFPTPLPTARRALARAYEEQSGTVTFDPGETRKPVALKVKGDTFPEANETFFFNLRGTSVPASDTQATVTITDDDPSISINNFTVNEGDSGTVEATFVVTLSRSKARTVTVHYATSDGTASAGSDYRSTNGTLEFRDGRTQHFLKVPIIPDDRPEGNETFLVLLFDPTRGQITGVQGTGTISNDDATVGPQEPGGTTPGGTTPGGPGGGGGFTAAGLRGVTATGDAVSFGAATVYGSPGPLNQRIVGAATTVSRNGYFLVSTDGGVFSFGDARFYGSTGSIQLNSPIVGMAATPTGNGYWFVTRDGKLFAFGDAPYFSPQKDLAPRPLVAMTV